MTKGDVEPPAHEDEFSLWLAACDERLAAGASVASLDEVGAPSALRPRLESQAAWCQLVRQIWPRMSTPERKPAETTPRAPGRPDEATPIELGRFVIRQELGRGSFGIVYLAYDPRLRREVALKVPRAEVLLTPELRGRFRHEALAAAGLNHPNIVPVYEAGEAGPVCFIASAYSPGITLATWLRRRETPASWRLAAGLVATLADAVEHAHRRGVLHRDLKPSNVLLELPEGADTAVPGDTEDLVPRVTDFGLAKLVDQGASANATLNPTQAGVLLGTPSYMAPEQADGKPGAVGPAADIYSLGVILYEILTGRPPFQEDSVLETLVLVRTQDPLPPRKLRPRLPRDLETICLHCLHKQPESRYSTAGALADDLRRFLAVQPILARPTPAWERAIIWSRRRPALAALAGTGAIAILTLALVIGVANIRLKRERDRAESQRLEAVANLRKARDAVDRMLTRVSEERLSGIPQVEPVQRALLEDALEFYRDFARQAHDDPEVVLEASQAYHRLGKTYHGFGRIDDAEKCFHEAIVLQEKLAAGQPASAAIRASLIDTHTSIARLRRDLDRTKESIAESQKSLALSQELIAADPKNSRYVSQQANALHVHAMALQDLGERKPAEAAYIKAIDLMDGLSKRYPTVREHPTAAAVSRHNLAILIEDDGRLDESVTIHELNLKFWEGLAASETSNQNARSKVALTLESLAVLLEKIGRKAEVEPVIRRAVRQRSDLTKDFPNTPWYFGRLAGSLGGLAKLAAARGDLAEARRLQEQALVARRSALALAPGNVEYTKALAVTAGELIETQMRLNAHEAVAETIAELVSLVPDSAKELIQAGSFLARCVSMAGSDQQLAETRRAELAKMYADRAVAMVRKAIEKGHHDLEALQKDPSFDSLRTRPDFVSLLGGSVAAVPASVP